jgi:hypothetical protein
MHSIELTMKKQLGSIETSHLLAILSIVGMCFAAYFHLNSIHESKGSSATGMGATFLFLKSQNQSIKNHYGENIRKGIDVEESERQLRRLDYEEQYINNIQQTLGVSPKEGS